MTTKPTDLRVDTTDVPVARISRNTAQDLIYITEDRLELRLRDYSSMLEKRKQWNGAAGTFLTFGATLLTATFNGFLGLDATQVKMAFVLGTIGSGVWLLMVAISRVREKPPTIAQLIASIRKANTSEGG